VRTGRTPLRRGEVEEKSLIDEKNCGSEAEQWAVLKTDNQVPESRVGRFVGSCCLSLAFAICNTVCGQEGAIGAGVLVWKAAFGSSL
jgi:hypothetical protein